MLSKILEELSYVEATTQPYRIRIAFDDRISQEIELLRKGYTDLLVNFHIPQKLFGITAYKVANIENDDGYEISIVI